MIPVKTANLPPARPVDGRKREILAQVRRNPPGFTGCLAPVRGARDPRAPAMVRSPRAGRAAPELARQASPAAPLGAQPTL